MGGISKATVCRTVNRVARCIASLYNQKIRMPSDENFLADTKTKFYKIARFPGVIGAIDCTHVAIQSPGGDQAELYRNRKGYFSMNVQAVCGADMKLLSVVARWFGSAHDSTIFTQSALYGRFVNEEFPNNCHLVGDAGYACKSFLLTQLGNPQNAAEQRLGIVQMQNESCYYTCIER